MLFNSLEFAIFLPLVWASYWCLPSSGLRARNVLLVAASYVFYGWWDWRFLSLIVISSAVDYAVGLVLHEATTLRRRRFLLGVSLATNLGMLGFFKYYDFFADSLVAALDPLGIEPGFVTLNIVLPVGISFYTFQTLSYTIDIYRGHMRPTRDVVAFFAFVSFFPQLVAGPIERAARLLPQFLEPRTFSNDAARNGLRLILWGLFKKVVVADGCARVVDAAFAAPETFNTVDLWAATFLFAMQIYGDFSGYSDIARGVAALFGFRLMRNFAMPYFARNVGDFWRRWHISLSTWFRDYVFIPLGGSRSHVTRNVLITFVTSGLWHGANWTFVIWGALHGVYYLIYRSYSRWRGEVSAAVPAWRALGACALTFVAVTAAWVFFRAPSLTAALEHLSLMANLGDVGLPRRGTLALATSAVFMTAEWTRRDARHVLALEQWPTAARWGLYLLLMAWILVESGTPQTFIYFQF